MVFLSPHHVTRFFSSGGKHPDFFPAFISLLLKLILLYHHFLVPTTISFFFSDLPPTFFDSFLSNFISVSRTFCVFSISLSLHACTEIALSPQLNLYWSIGSQSSSIPWKLSACFSLSVNVTLHTPALGASSLSLFSYSTSVQWSLVRTRRSNPMLAGK